MNVQIVLFATCDRCGLSGERYFGPFDEFPGIDPCRAGLIRHGWTVTDRLTLCPQCTRARKASMTDPQDTPPAVTPDAPRPLSDFGLIDRTLSIYLTVMEDHANQVPALERELADVQARLDHARSAQRKLQVLDPLIREVSSGDWTLVAMVTAALEQAQNGVQLDARPPGAPPLEFIQGGPLVIKPLVNLAGPSGAPIDPAPAAEPPVSLPGDDAEPRGPDTSKSRSDLDPFEGADATEAELEGAPSASESPEPPVVDTAATSVEATLQTTTPSPAPTHLRNAPPADPEDDEAREDDAPEAPLTKREQILRHLKAHPWRSLMELTADLKFSKGTVSGQVSQCKTAGLLAMRMDGPTTRYALAGTPSLDSERNFEEAPAPLPPFVEPPSAEPRDRVLALLAQRPAGRTMTDLAVELGLTPARIGPVVGQLLRHGRITREGIVYHASSASPDGPAPDPEPEQREHPPTPPPEPTPEPTPPAPLPEAESASRKSGPDGTDAPTPDPPRPTPQLEVRPQDKRVSGMPPPIPEPPVVAPPTMLGTPALTRSEQVALDARRTIGRLTDEIDGFFDEQEEWTEKQLQARLSDKRVSALRSAVQQLEDTGRLVREELGGAARCVYRRATSGLPDAKGTALTPDAQLLRQHMLGRPGDTIPNLEQTLRIPRDRVQAALAILVTRGQVTFRAVGSLRIFTLQEAM